MKLAKNLAIIVAILALSIAITVLSKKHVLSGRDHGGTKGLFSYSHVSNDELYYPPTYLLVGEISRNGGGLGLCTAVEGPLTKAYGWPFYYMIDDRNCELTYIFPLVFVLNTLIFAGSITLLYIFIKRLLKL